MTRAYSFWVKPKHKNNGWVKVYSVSNFWYTETKVDNQSIVRIYRHRFIGKLFNKFVKNAYADATVAEMQIMKGLGKK